MIGLLVHVAILFVLLSVAVQMLRLLLALAADHRALRKRQGLADEFARE